MVSEGLCQVLWVFYLRFISQNSFYFLWFAVALNVVTVIAVYWIPESPRYLYGINNLEKCRETLIYIAEKNGVQNYEPAVFEVDFEIMAENIDDASDEGRPSEQVPMIKDGD